MEQLCVNTDLYSSLGNGDSLLLHGLVNGHLILGIHFVKFIDAAHSIVSQHKGTCFNDELVRFLILYHSSSKTCG